MALSFQVKAAYCHHEPEESKNWTLRGAPDMPNYELGASGQPCWPLGNDEVSKLNDELNVFPNPVSCVLYIKTENKGKRELYNSVGQQILYTDKNEINVRLLAKGVYYLKVENVVRKLVIE